MIGVSTHSIVHIHDADIVYVVVLEQKINDC